MPPDGFATVKDLTKRLEVAFAKVEILVFELDAETERLGSSSKRSMKARAVVAEQLVEPWRSAFLSEPGRPSWLDGWRKRVEQARLDAVR